MKAVAAVALKYISGVLNNPTLVIVILVPLLIRLSIRVIKLITRVS